VGGKTIIVLNCSTLGGVGVGVKMDVFEDAVRVGVRGQVGFIDMKYSIFICHQPHEMEFNSSQ